MQPQLQALRQHPLQLALGLRHIRALRHTGLETIAGDLQRAFIGSDAALEQRQLRAGFHEPVTRLVRAVVDVGGGNFRDLPNLAFAVVGIGLLVVAFWDSMRQRQRA